MEKHPTNGVDTDRSPPVHNLRSKFEQLALDQSPTSRPRQSNGTQREFLDPSAASPSPRPRAASNTTSNGTPFDISHSLRPSSSSSDLNPGAKRPPPPPPPSRPSKIMPSSNFSNPDLSAALLRPVPIPPNKAHASPRPQSPGIPPPPRHKLATAPASPRQPPSAYPPDTSNKPPIPPRHAKSDTSFLKPQVQNTDNMNTNMLDTYIRTISPFSDDDTTPTAPPTHPSRRKPAPPPSGESSLASSESDLSVSSRSSRYRTDAPFTSSPNTSPVPPPLPFRRPGSGPGLASSSSEESTNTSPPLPARPSPNLTISPHISTSDSPSPSSSTPSSSRKPFGSHGLPPPPTRTILPGDPLPAPRRPPTPAYSDDESVDESDEPVVDPLPDSSRTSRRPPVMSFHYANVEPNIHAAIPGAVCVAGTCAVVAGTHHLRVYDLVVSDVSKMTLEMKAVVGKECKIASMEWRPSVVREERGCVLWVGTKEGHLVEVDVRSGVVRERRYNAHHGAVNHIFRYGRSMVTIDESGKGFVWAPTPDPDGGAGVDVSLEKTTPRVVRIGEHCAFLKIIQGRLWTATRGDTQAILSASSSAKVQVPVIKIYDIFKPGARGSIAVVPSEYVGAALSATVVAGTPGLVYVGHEAGWMSIWSLPSSSSPDNDDGAPTCIEVMRISHTDVISLEGVHDRLWVGSRSGGIAVYDVGVRPWVVTNAWAAHPGTTAGSGSGKTGVPVARISVDVYGIDRIGRVCVLSVGRDEQIRFWDGLCGLDWVDEELLKYEHTFAKTRPLRVLVVSWNLDAARPEYLNTGDATNTNFFTDALHSASPSGSGPSAAPDIVSFGFQEVIDLEDTKLAARNLLASASSSNSAADRVSSAYRRWGDRLAGALREAFPGTKYSVVCTHSLVGLFSVVFVRDGERERGAIREVGVAHVKRGMKGRYGNKGAIISRFVLDDTSICLINWHLAAGQSAVRQRNGDVTAILEKGALFPETHFPFAYVGGGDGTMILDHEIVITSGDMNYRIDHRRDAIISSIRSNDLSSLLTHDQLLRELKHNRACRLRGFSEGPLTFAPTYKYDRHTDDYDTSEKRRAPAWCDRVLWRSRVPERVRLVGYRRYEVDVSDHRPVSAAFEVTVKRLESGERGRVKKAVQERWVGEQERILREAKKFYVGQALI
ncbi:hypothetical protein C0995_013972 [Termitomyces sp. Mi166|nr:hypothetical protein C0995_013972 [Termitomyces sp. Mi166\